MVARQNIHSKIVLVCSFRFFGVRGVQGQEWWKGIEDIGYALVKAYLLRLNVMYPTAMPIRIDLLNI